MSALAMLASESGAWVSGSDRSDSETLKRLKGYGINAYVGSNNAVVAGSDLVVYTSAIGEDDTELKFARANKILCMERKAFLALIAKTCKNVIAIAGSHGKTTTAAMLCHIFNQMALPFRGHVGGNVKSIGANYVNDGDDWFITEACEYGRSFLALSPDTGVILNCDYDHPDTYPTKDDMYEAFVTFAKQSKAVIVGEEAFDVLRLENHVDADKIYTFGFGSNAHFQAVNLKNRQGKFSFDVLCDGKPIGKYSLNLYGKHNVLNALAAIAVCYLNWLDMQEICEYVNSFDGVDRRFCDCGTTIGGARVIVDYAHHPKEIAATIDALRLMDVGRIIAVFEPHTYSRTKALLEEFAESFYWADEVIILPTYGARESKDMGIGGAELADYINRRGEGALYLDSYESVRDYVNGNSTFRDTILVLGAGSVDKLGQMLTNSQR